jgi:precorrin-6A/cobalt-precorrin-6A reductase
MIGLVLGTSEGREILSILNETTDDIFISTTSSYGASLYEKYRYKKVNSIPLDENGFCDAIKENDITVFADVTHPYATEVSRNIISACKKCKIKYARYERAGVLQNYAGVSNVVAVKSYDEMPEKLHGISGTVMNTTGSRNISKVLGMDIKNRIIHRVLPSSKVIGEIERLGVTADDIVALKMDLNIQRINDALIDAYNVEAILAKDSGVEGGTVEKIEAALRNDIKIIVLERQKTDLPNTFYDMKEFSQHCLKAGAFIE